MQADQWEKTALSTTLLDLQVLFSKTTLHSLTVSSNISAPRPEKTLETLGICSTLSMFVFAPNLCNPEFENVLRRLRERKLKDAVRAETTDSVSTRETVGLIRLFGGFKKIKNKKRDLEEKRLQPFL